MDAPLPRAMTMRNRALALIAAGIVLHVLLGLAVGPSVDESYAIVMGRRLALSYYDHPPFLFWIPGLAARLAGSEHEFFVRLPFVLLFAGTTWLVYRLGTLLFGELAGLLASVTLNLVLFFNLCAGGWVLPDGPLLFWSTAAAICLARALGLDQDEAATGPARVQGHRSWWLGFGLFTGLALLSKYHGIFLLAGAAAFLITCAPYRAWLRRAEPYLSALVAVLVFSPVLLWNATHDWASFRFQGGRAGPAVEGGGSAMVDTIGGQAIWLLPWIWIPLLVVLFAALRRGSADPRRWLLVCLGAGPIFAFSLLAILGRRGLPHWSLPGYFMLLPALGVALSDRLRRRDPWARRWLWASTAGLALAFGLLVGQLHGGVLDRIAPRLLERGDPTDDLLQWREPVVAALAAWGYPQPGVTIAGSDWADAAKLAYALGPAVKVVALGEDVRGFEAVSSQSALVGQDVLLLASRSAHKIEPMIAYSPYFAHMAPLGMIQIGPPGARGMTLTAYLGRGLLRPIPQLRRH